MFNTLYIVVNYLLLIYLCIVSPTKMPVHHPEQKSTIGVGDNITSPSVKIAHKNITLLIALIISVIKLLILFIAIPYNFNSQYLSFKIDKTSNPISFIVFL